MEDWIGVAALIIALFALLVMLLRTRKRISDVGSTYHAPEDDRAQTHAVRRELEQLLVDIESMCRDITARLDTKIRVLNELIIEADQKISDLKTVEPENTLQKEKEEKAPEQETPEAAPEKKSPPEPEPENEEKPLEDDPRFEKIFKLADSGTDLISIARETGMPKGEIKLILGLRKRKNK